MEISKRLRMALVEFPIDIILKSEEEIEAQKGMIGSVVRATLKEGVSLSSDRGLVRRSKSIKSVIKSGHLADSKILIK